MKRKLTLGIVLILIASFSLNLLSCNTVEQNTTANTTATTEDAVKETTSQETTDNEIEETTPQETTDDDVNETTCAETTCVEAEETTCIETTYVETDDTTAEETTEDDYQGCVPMDKRQQIFNSLDELLLAIEDIDAFCEIVTDNGEGEPVEPEFIKEKLSVFSDYPFALIDNCSSIWAELTHNGLQIVLTSKGGTDYTFIYWFDADSFHLANGEVFGEFKIDDQYIKMYSFSNLVGLKYSYVGVWTNNDMPVFVGVAGDSEELKSPESFQDQEIYTVDLFELASQRYGEETTEDDDFPFITPVHPAQSFVSFDDLLLAVEDVDAFCDKVHMDAHGGPIDPEFIKENLELLVPHLFPYTDEYSLYFVILEKMFVGRDVIINIVYTTEDDITYYFEAYLNREVDYNYDPDRIPDEKSCEFKIGNQLVKMYMGSASYSENWYSGVWKNGDIYFKVLVYGKNLTDPEDLIDFYTVDLRELASQRYGEETTSEGSDTEGSETESVETESSIAN